MLNKYNVKTNIFVDAAYLLQTLKYKDKYPELQNDYEIVTNNIKWLANEGHAIHLHLHPQWCYSLFDGEKWILDHDHYKLNDMPLEEQKKLIKDGVELLNSFVNKKVTAYRAGGYSIENFNELYDTFLSLGITVDTSVLRGAFCKSKFQNYDYRLCPPKSSYMISGNLNVEDLSGGIKEYPISTKKTLYLNHFLKKHILPKEIIKGKASQNRWGDGVSISQPTSTIGKLWGLVKKLFSVINMRACIDECYNFDSVYNYSKRTINGEDFVIIGHPKLISPCSIAILEQFIINHPKINYKLF